MCTGFATHIVVASARFYRDCSRALLFDPSFLSGEQGSLIEQRYTVPITAASKIEIVPLDPCERKHEEVLRSIRDAFLLPEEDFGYELRLRNILSDIWLCLFELLRPQLEHSIRYGKDKNSECLKLMMIFISELAATAFLSERECFRIFKRDLHVTPMEYIQSVRLQEARRLLARTQKPITEIIHACGFGSSSYFGKIFRDTIGCTPSEYRQKWQNERNVCNGRY